MGLMDDLAKMATDALGDALGGEGLGKVALSHLGGDAGLQGVLNQLQQGGLAEQVQSWLGNGHNLPISPEQISSVLGNSQLVELAGKVGVTPDQVSGFLAQHLPSLADKLPKA